MESNENAVCRLLPLPLDTDARNASSVVELSNTNKIRCDSLLEPLGYGRLLEYPL